MEPDASFSYVEMLRAVAAPFCRWILRQESATWEVPDVDLT